MRAHTFRPKPAVKPHRKTVVIPPIVRMCEFSQPCDVAIWRAFDNSG